MVLEALAAISLASSVIQFVDFSVKLISKGNEYYHSADGVLAEHNELHNIAGNFEDLNAKLKNSLSLVEPKKLLSDEEKALQSITQDCLAVADDFKRTLEELRRHPGNNVWKSFRQAIKTRWKQKKLDETLNKLRLFREDLAVHLLVVIRYKGAFSG